MTSEINLLWIGLIILYLCSLIIYIRLTRKIKKMDESRESYQEYKDKDMSRQRGDIREIDYKLKAISDHLKLKVFRPSREYKVEKDD